MAAETEDYRKIWLPDGGEMVFIQSIHTSGDVGNNQGPDLLVGPKSLDPNYCRQQILWLYDLCLEVLTLHGIELRLFWAKAFPLLNY